MKFIDLVFDQRGCCGTHTWAKVQHASGIVTEIYDDEDGTYSVSTRAGNVLLKPPQSYTDKNEIEKRIGVDALMSE
jgi:hypothetical protein